MASAQIIIPSASGWDTCMKFAMMDIGFVTHEKLGDNIFSFVNIQIEEKKSLTAEDSKKYAKDTKKLKKKTL